MIELKDLKNELEKAKKILRMTEKYIDNLESKGSIETIELEDLYKIAKETEDEMEIYKYLAYKYFGKVLK